MSTASNRQPQPGRLSGETILLWIVLVAVVATAGIIWVSVQLGHRLAGITDTPSGVIETVVAVLKGTTAWPMASTVVAAGLALLLVAAGVAGYALWQRRGRRRSRVDHTDRVLATRRDLEPLSRKAVAATAARLGVPADASPGVPIGATLSGFLLFGSWEDMHIDIWGPRTGKTTSRAVPAILEAPGAVLVTSNKRDVVDATRDVRAAAGPVWVFDPQAVAGEAPSWWWNPLSYVVDEVKAARLAEHFAAGSRDPGARTDAFFDPAGQDLLAGLFLAAAVRGLPITTVYGWLTDPLNDDPVQILREHDFPLIADQVQGVIGAPDKQRGGIYGTAQQMASCLTNRQILTWVTPPANPAAAAFSPAEFVRSGGTLYSLSKEGRGTAGPLVTALTVAVTEAAEELAASSAGGRLPVPMLGVLDEAANVCRWKDLPALYSHFGSRGIVLMTILQSWSQGVEVWGEAGMKKLWSSANVKVYGGGVAERGFLDDLSVLIGDFDKYTTSISQSKAGRQWSQQLHRERILDVAELAALPKGRAIVLASGTRPTLIATQPWMTGPHAAAVRASIAAHDPQAGVTLDAAAAESRHVEETAGRSHVAEELA